MDGDWTCKCLTSNWMDLKRHRVKCILTRVGLKLRIANYDAPFMALNWLIVLNIALQFQSYVQQQIKIEDRNFNFKSKTFGSMFKLVTLMVSFSCMLNRMPI